ncbi:MAG: DNA primase [Lachnospiraceae bacterium]|nr:DNA primase [Lachnospiraceae bacterium]MBR1877062.1 DNA primase [Lachnospiraceae bacterium]
MPRYKDELLEEIRSRNDIVDVIGNVVKLKRSGANYFGLCPFHSEKTGSFSVNREKQMFYCFGCGTGGNVISFVMDYENYSFNEAVKYLAERAGINLPDYEETPEEKKMASFKSSVMDCLKSAAIYYYKKLYSNEGRTGLEYLKKRGLSDDMIRSFGLGYSGKGFDHTVNYLKEKGFSEKVIDAAGLCTISEKHGMTDRFFNRVMFPIMDINNKVIGFGGRVMGEGQPKYLNSPETIVFDKSHNMYGLNVARRSRKPYRIVCEGYMDVISMHQAGFTEAVASLGTAFTAGHANLLRRYTKDVILTYDSDDAGKKAAVRAIPICRSANLTSKVMNLEPYKDPDEFIKALGADEFQKRISEAENSFFFELRYAEGSFDMSDPEGRTAFSAEAAKKLAAIDDELARDNYISAVASKYTIREDALRRAVALAFERGGDTKSYEFTEKASAPVKDKDTVNDKAERHLLTWMTNEKAVFEAVKEYLKPEDFPEGTIREMAKKIYEGYENGSFNPAGILTDFAYEDNAKEAASIINTELDAIDTTEDREKALTDLVIRVKKNALYRNKNQDDTSDPLKKAKEEKKALASLKSMKIKI